MQCLGAHRDARRALTESVIHLEAVSRDQVRYAKPSMPPSPFIRPAHVLYHMCYALTHPDPCPPAACLVTCAARVRGRLHSAAPSPPCADPDLEDQPGLHLTCERSACRYSYTCTVDIVDTDKSVCNQGVGHGMACTPALMACIIALFAQALHACQPQF